MVIQLYSEKSPDSGAQIGLIQNLVSRGLVEGQFTPRNVKVEFVKADQAGEKFKGAVKKAKNAQYLDDAEMVLVFQSPKAAPAPEQPEEAPAPEENAPEDKGGDETVSESVKVQDLSNQVGLKTVGKKSCSCGKKTCCCGKKTVKEEEAPKKKAPAKKAKSKKDLEKKAPEKKAPEKDDPEKDAPVSEAEMEATGEELKAKIVDLVKRVLYIPDGEEVEMVTLEDFREGYDTFFTKLSFKD